MKIMQCWDDGVANDAPLVDMLRKYHAKATFNINPGVNGQHDRLEVFEELFRGQFAVYHLSLDEMKDLYRGFKIAGHSMTHPHLIQLTAADLQSELGDCMEFIRDYFGQDEVGFAYPFGDYNAEVKQALRNVGYRYARTVLKSDGILRLDDPMELHPHCHFMSSDFWTKYEKVREQNGIFYFWGHSYEMMDDKALWDEFESKLARINEDPNAEWIDVIDLFA